MKQKLIQLLISICMCTMLAGMATSCGKQKTNDTASNSSTGTETGTEMNTETETAPTEYSTETENNTETQQTSDTTENDTENENHTETQQSSEISENDPESDLYLDLATTLAKINGVQAGSAGTSLRAEEALTALTAFINTYGTDTSSQTISKLTTQWIETVKEDYPTVKEDFGENFYYVTSLAEVNEPKLFKSDAYLNIVNGIHEAMGIE